MDDELVSATYIDRFLASSALSLATLIFTLIGNDHNFFLELSYEFCVKT